MFTFADQEKEFNRALRTEQVPDPMNRMRTYVQVPLTGSGTTYLRRVFIFYSLELKYSFVT